jgi:hypothetical protein
MQPHSDPLLSPGGKVSANRPSGIILTSPDANRQLEHSERRRDRLALFTYWAEAGVVSTVVGAWASVAFSGRVRILVWTGITAALAAAAIVLAEPAIRFLSRCYRMSRVGHRDNGS